MGIGELIDQVSAYMSTQDVNIIKKAYRLAKEAHEGQYRQSGEAYIEHPVAVSIILADLKLDATTIAAALLHDVVEDTTVTVEDLEEQFGPELALLVSGVTKLKRIKYKSKEQQRAENHRRMFVAMAKDIRVILIKLADRLHNMRTLRYLSEEKQRKKAEETLEIFAPLAHRLGIQTIKWELEDLSLRYINPQQYYRIVHLMKQKRAEREQHINDVIEVIREKIDEMNIKAEIYGRPKHIFGIYRKMKEQGKAFNEIYDLMAIRIIVETVRDCYAALGIVHTCWKPLPGRFKDYIAMPKPNMYQSLHTTVMSFRGQPLEVQIRTHDMHYTAEYGIAAHWAYKEGQNIANHGLSGLDEKLTWFREVLESQQDAQDPREFMESLKMDLFSDVVFVFTPKGDVLELPSGSVPLDFAYRIHTEVGNRCVGAKVNGKIVPLDRPLKTGDIVQILTSQHSYGPSRDWLKIAQSSTARSKIKQYFKKEKREESIAKGKELVEQELEKYGFPLKKVLSDDNVEQVAKRFNFKGMDDMYAAVGYGGITAAQIATRLTDKLRQEQQIEGPEMELVEPEQPTQRRRFDHGVRVKGIDNLLIRLSRCCNPVPGDEIVGFITRGRGISVHRQDCPNIAQHDEERLLPVEWEGEPDKSYNVEIEINALDRRGLLNEVLQAVNDSKTNIVAVEGRTDRNRMASICITLAVAHLDHLHRVVDQIKQVKDIYSVQRMTQ